MNSSSLPKIVFLDTVDSTNTFIAQRLQTDILPNGYCVAADYQRAGRGQAGNVWESASGQNLLFSVLLHTQHFPLDRQFVLSKVVSVAIHKFLADRGIDTKIKYPNDILYGNKKLAGILIENRIAGKQMTFSIVGVGLNINQTEFVENKATAISIRQITNRAYDTKTLLAELREAIVTLVSEAVSRQPVPNRRILPLRSRRRDFRGTGCRCRRRGNTEAGNKIGRRAAILFQTGKVYFVEKY